MGIPNKETGNKLTIVFRTFALENVRYTKDVRDEIDDVRFVFNTYGKYFTFNSIVICCFLCYNSSRGRVDKNESVYIIKE